MDLALLSIDASGLTPLKAAAVSPARVGEMVFAFGHPWGQRNTVTRGIVSALVTAQNRRGDKLPIVRPDRLSPPGNSGGPLVNASGEVVGINAMIVGGDQSVSIAASVATDFVKEEGNCKERDIKQAASTHSERCDLIFWKYRAFGVNVSRRCYHNDNK